MSISVAKWTLFLPLCASRITSILLLTFSSYRAAIVSSFFHAVHCSFCIQNLHRLEHKNKCVNQVSREDATLYLVDS